MKKFLVVSSFILGGIELFFGSFFGGFAVMELTGGQFNGFHIPDSGVKNFQLYLKGMTGMWHILNWFGLLNIIIGVILIYKWPPNNSGK